MKLNFREPIAWLIILALSFFLWGQCQSNKVDKLQSEASKKELLQQVKAFEDTARQAAVRADSLQASFISRRTKDSIDLRALSVRNKAMSETAQKLRLPVQPMIDTVQALAEFVTAYDSLLVGKDTEINELKLRHSAQIVELQLIIDAKTEQLMIEQVKGNLWRETAQASEKDYNKERRKKGFWKVTSAVLAAGIIYVSLRE